MMAPPHKCSWSTDFGVQLEPFLTGAAETSLASGGPGSKRGTTRQKPVEREAGRRWTGRLCPAKQATWPISATWGLGAPGLCCRRLDWVAGTSRA